MRVQYATLTIIGLCVAAIGAWLVVSLVNELSLGSSPPKSSLALAGPDAPDTESSGAATPPAGLTGEEAAKTAPARAEAAAGGKTTVPETGVAGGTAPATEIEPAESAADKLTARIDQQEPAPIPARVLPREAGPYRAAFIREPPGEGEFPVIRLGEVSWRVDPAADGTVTAELDVVSVEPDQRAGLRLAGAVTSAGEAILLVTLSLGEGEFLPKAGSVTVEAVTARGRDDRSVRIPAITLPYERPDLVDFRVSADELLATLAFATWFDIGLRIDGELYTITIQNWPGARDIVSAIAYGA